MVSKRNMLMADENPMDLLHLITRIRNQRERSRLGFARVVMSSRMEPNELPTYFHYYKNFIFTKRNNYRWLKMALGKRLKSLIETHQHSHWIEILKGICFRLYSLKTNWKIDSSNAYEYSMKETINDFSN